MSLENQYASTAFAAPPPFVPSYGLHRFLLVGAVAALVDGCLSASAMAVLWREGARPGFTLSMGLNLAAILPGSAVLSCYLAMARELDSIALRKGAIGYFACSWLAVLLTLGDPAVLTRWGMIAVEGCFLASVAGIALVMFRDAGGKATRGLLAALGVAFVVFLKFGLKFVLIFARQLGAIGNMDLETAIGIELVATGLFALSYGVWLAVTKLRLRGTLGVWSLWSGLAELCSLLLYFGLATWLAVEVVAVMGRPNANDEAVREVLQSWTAAGAMCQIVTQLVTSSLTALLFLSVRSRAADDWRADFAPASVSLRDR